MSRKGKKDRKDMRRGERWREDGEKNIYEWRRTERREGGEKGGRNDREEGSIK